MRLKHLRKIGCIVFFLLMQQYGFTQHLLGKTVSMQEQQQSLAQVLKKIGTQAGFYFSYNSNIIKEDSLVTVDVKQVSVRELLRTLLGNRYQYKESGNYVIIQPIISGAFYTVSGYIKDAETGKPIADASVYDPKQFLSAFTDAEGYFKLTLKNRGVAADIRFSRISYQDAAAEIPAGADTTIEILLERSDTELTPIVIQNTIEKNWLARMFLSSRQVAQSINLRNFFTSSAVQVSLVPGVGTYKRLGAQAENKFSFNVVGGYTAAVNGFELGTVFNIVKKDVRHVQVAGLFNLVGGQTHGVQVAGFHNNVLDSVRGLQLAGFSNKTDTISGVQLAGALNLAGVKAGGIQMAGALNTAGSAHGLQLSGVANIVKKEMHGVQISGLLNYAKTVKGVQIGIVNIADSVDGYSIGLINISRSYHVLAVYADETAPVNLAFKSGSKKLYSIVGAGYNSVNKINRLYMSYGIGTEISLRENFFLSPEIKSYAVYAGNWNELDNMLRLNINANIRLGKTISVFAGPSFAFYKSSAQHTKGSLIFTDDHMFKLGSGFGWIGWQAGVNLF